VKKQGPYQTSWAHRTALISVSCSPQPDTSQSRKTTDMSLCILTYLLTKRVMTQTSYSVWYGDRPWCWRSRDHQGVQAGDSASR